MVTQKARLARKTGLSLGPILLYVTAVAVVAGGLLAWDYTWTRKQEEARKPPPPEVIAKNLVENIIGPGSVKDVKVDEKAGTVQVTFESATYPPAARAAVPGEVLAKNLDRLAAGMRISKDEPLVYVKTADSKEAVAAKAEQAGRVIQVLVKAGQKVEENNALVLIEPDDKTLARQNLETEGLLAWQAIIQQLRTINTVTSVIIYHDLTLATVVGKRGQKNVTSAFHESLK